MESTSVQNKPQPPFQRLTASVTLWKTFSGAVPKGGKVGFLLGSFDPFHFGHQAMVELLRSRCHFLLLLVPSFSFDKEVNFPENATLEQRIEMMVSVYEKEGSVGIGLTEEVLYLRLRQEIQTAFPGSTIVFGLGADRFPCFVDSQKYFDKCAFPWTEREELMFTESCENLIVFARDGETLDPIWSSMHQALAANITVLHPSVHVSSTKIREVASRCKRQQCSIEEVVAQLSGYVPQPIAAFIAKTSLYTSVV